MPLMLDIEAFNWYYKYMARYELVSLNAPIDEPQRYFDYENNGKVGRFYSEKFGIFILGQYAHAYEAGIKTIMDGIVALHTTPTMTKAAKSIQASPFGYKDFVVSDYGQDSRLIIPYAFTNLIYFDNSGPRDAVASYHNYLIQSTNAALESVASPYRLDTM